MHWPHECSQKRTLSFIVHTVTYTTKMDFSDDGEMISTTQLEDEIECCDEDEELIVASNNFACNVTASVSTYFLRWSSSLSTQRSEYTP